MTRITTACPTCGRVELDKDDVTLVVSPLEGRSWYLFDCYGCLEQIMKPAPSSVAVALRGIEVATWTVPAEVLERVAPDEAPRLGSDDVLDAVLQLRGQADLVALAAGSPVRPDPGWAQPPAANPNPGGAGTRPSRPGTA
jgi:hypothetical protein